jgi:hypothetical protein
MNTFWELIKEAEKAKEQPTVGQKLQYYARGGFLQTNAKHYGKKIIEDGKKFNEQRRKDMLGKK